MKTILKRMYVLIVLTVLYTILTAGVLYPIGFYYDDKPPLWIAFILYPLFLLSIASADKVITWARNEFYNE